MTMAELIDQHARDTAEGGGFLKRAGEFRASSENQLTEEWLKHSLRLFAVELLGLVKPRELSPQDCADAEWKDGYNQAGVLIRNALEELRK